MTVPLHQVCLFSVKLRFIVSFIVFSSSFGNYLLDGKPAQMGSLWDQPFTGTWKAANFLFAQPTITSFAAQPLPPP